MNHQYHLYTTKEQALKKFLPTTLRKKPNAIDICLNIITSKAGKSESEYMERMCDFYEIVSFMSHDKLWEKDGKKTIFVRDYNDLENLLGFQYSIDDSASIAFKFRTFSVSIPKKYHVNGVEIPSFLVSTSSLKDINEIEDKLLRKYDADNVDDCDTEYTSDLTLTIQYYDNETGEHKKISSLVNDTLKTLTSPTFEDFCKSGERQYYENPMEDNDNKVAYYITRIAMGLMISDSATNGEIIKEGLPFDFTSKLKLKSIFKSCASVSRYFYDFSTLSKFKEASLPSEHYRKWHFRNLKHSKFYQGVFKDLKKGTRWTLVRDSIVNRTITDYTLTE